MIQKETMSLANADKHKRKGLWTREEGKEKSVIEFVMTNTEYLNSIKEMIINETKEHATYRLSNVMLLKIDFHTETIQTKEHMYILCAVWFGGRMNLVAILRRTC